jgi:hypothetical protein
MTSLFGRNPVAMAILGVVMLAGGLAMHSRFLPWIGGVLLVVGGVKTAAGAGRRGRPGGGIGRDAGRGNGGRWQ